MEPPHYRGRFADEPSLPPDDDDLGQRPAALLTLCVEGTQPRDECVKIAAVVRMVLPYERPAASFVRLVLFHLRDRGHSLRARRGEPSEFSSTPKVSPTISCLLDTT